MTATMAATVRLVAVEQKADLAVRTETMQEEEWALVEMEKDRERPHESLENPALNCMLVEEMAMEHLKNQVPQAEAVKRMNPVKLTPEVEAVATKAIAAQKVALVL